MNISMLLYVLPSLLLVLQKASTAVEIGPDQIGKSSKNDQSESILTEEQPHDNKGNQYTSMMNTVYNMATKLQQQTNSLIKTLEYTMTLNDEENPNNETLFTSTKNSFSKILSKANELKSQYSPFTKTLVPSTIASDQNENEIQSRSLKKDLNIVSEEKGTETVVDIDDVKIENSVLKEESNTNESNGSNTNKLTRTDSLKKLAHNIVLKGYEFKKQYGFLMPQLLTLTLPGGQAMNIFRVIGVLPYVILAMQKANTPVVEQDTNPMAEFGKLNLASVLENPEKLKELFSNKSRGEFITDSMKMIAGSNASTVVDNVMEIVNRNANDEKDGENGITGERLANLLTSNTSFKNLFKEEKGYYQGLNLLNAIVGSTLSPELENTKNEIINRMNDSTTQGENNKVIDVVKGTLKDSVLTYFKVGQTIINDKIRDLNVEAGKNVDNWKLLKPGDAGSNTFTGKMKSIILNNAPNEALKLFAKGYVLSNEYSSCVIPQVARYYLPVGVGMDILKFMCLTTYVMHIAKTENLIPDIEQEKFKALGLDKLGIHKLGINIQEINTGKIVDAINNAKILKKLSPFEKYSNAGVNMLRFLAGPDASLIDKIAEQLKLIKKGKKDDQPLTLTDIVQNTEFFKKLYSMKEFTDDKIKKYLGMDVGQLMNDIMEEMNKNNGENIEQESNISKSLYGVPRYLSKASSAVYTVGTRNINDKIESIKAEFQKGLSAGENIDSGIVVRAANNWSKGLKLVNRYRSFIQPTKSSTPITEIPNNGEVTVTINN